MLHNWIFQFFSAQVKFFKQFLKIDSFQLSVFNKVYKNPATRDPRGYIIPINQSTTAIHFVNILIKSGIKVHRASADFMVGTKKYLAGSYIVKTNQNK